MSLFRRKNGFYGKHKKSQTKEITWKDIQIGDKFVDGSTVTEIHDRKIEETYAVSWLVPLSTKSNVKQPLLRRLFKPFSAADVRNMIECGDKRITQLSKDHLLLCDVSELPEEIIKGIDESFKDYIIPTEWNRHIYYLDESQIELDEDFAQEQMDKGIHPEHIEFEHSYEEKMEVAKSDPAKVSDYLYWLPVNYIHQVVSAGYIISSNGHILDTKYIGKKEVFCVATDSHKYDTNGLTHHNSVMLQNIIFHALTHPSDIAVGCVDLKHTEFTSYKNIKGVVAVANSVREARELLLIARRVMDTRNAEMAKVGLKDMMDEKPTQYTGYVEVAGRKLKDDTPIEIRTRNGEEKTVTVKELEQYLEWNEEDVTD